MAKAKRGVSTPQTEDTSWLDGEETIVSKSGLIKVLSLRSGDIVLAKDKVLRYHKTLEVDQNTFDWLQKTFPGMIEKI